MKIIKNAIRCKKCGSVIESEYTHDFKQCECGACCVDGGRSYLKRCGNIGDWEDMSICIPEEGDDTIEDGRIEFANKIYDFLQDIINENDGHTSNYSEKNT